jgi:hypothetical protein
VAPLLYLVALLVALLELLVVLLADVDVLSGYVEAPAFALATLTLWMASFCSSSPCHFCPLPNLAQCYHLIRVPPPR